MRLQIPALALLALLSVAASSRADLREVYYKNEELKGRLDELVPDFTKLHDEAERTRVKDKLVPLLKEMVSNLEQIKGDEKGGGLYAGEHIALRAMLYVMGDADTIKLVDEWSKSEETGRDQHDGKWVALCVDYFNAKDEPAREKIVTRFGDDAASDQAKAGKIDTLAGEQAATYEAASAAEFMLSVTRDEKLQDRILAVMRNKLHNIEASLVASKYEAPRKLRAAMNKPVNFQYQSFDGKTVKASDFRGHVLLLTFFDSQRPRSVKELSRASRMMVLNRSKGLDVVGVDCDKDRTNLSLFLKSNPRYSMPILFDSFIAEESGGWHPLATLFGVSKLPFNLLVDRKGVLRYANPSDLEAKIKALLDEKP